MWMILFLIVMGVLILGLTVVGLAKRKQEAAARPWRDAAKAEREAHGPFTLHDPNEPGPIGGPILALAALLLLVTGAVALVNAVKIVRANEVGVQVTLGSINNDPLKSGVHWVQPWSEVETLPTRPRTFSTVANVRTIEAGIISTRLSARWATDEDSAADLYQQVRTGDEEEIQKALIEPNLRGAAGAYLGGKTNSEVVNGQNWVTNATGIETQARSYLGKYGIDVDTVKVTETAPDPDTDAAIRRFASQQRETLIAQEADETAKAQAARDLTEATGKANAAAKVAGLNPAQVQVLCLQAAERIMNKNQEKGLPTYVLPCGTEGVRVTTQAK